MKMTSMDIKDKEFKKVIRGYDLNEVDEFIIRVSEDYEALYKENSAYKEKVMNFEEKIEHYAKIENTIQNTLLLAQNTAEQAKLSAQKEAELIIRNANESAQRIIEKANDEVIRINDDHERLKQEFIKFRTRYRNFMTTQMEMFSGMEKDFVKNYDVGAVIEEKQEAIQPEKSIEDSIKIKNINLEEHNFNEDLNEIKSFFAEEK